MNFLEIYWTDVYKTGHKPMLPIGSTLMYSNNTPRSGKHSNCPNDGEVVQFGQQKLVRQMKWDWDANFFNRPIQEIDKFGEDMTKMLGLSEPYDVTHFKELHKLGYLPVRIKALEEGTVTPYKIPSFTIVNTKPLNGYVADWIVNYLETILSAEYWQGQTSATFVRSLRKLGKEWIMKTNPEAIGFLDYQFHDFSMRGMGGKSAIVNSGLGFATGSRGSDTLPVIPAARMYYDEVEPCINSVIASEHAIMCSLTGFFMQNSNGNWTKVGDFEYEMFVHLLEKFPTGILSLVMDTFDLWRAITEYCVKAKDLIMSRDGKLVIRPDSGDPVDILCGVGFEENGKYYKYNRIPQIPGEEKVEISYPEHKGVIELLWDIFSGTVSSTGYKVLDSHIGAIYGDSINYDRASRIFQRLADKGFASTNVVLGVGSYSLQYVTRDTHGSAQKATYIEILQQVDKHGIMAPVGIEIFKDPITDGGVKKSAKGLLMVYEEDGVIKLKDQCTWEEEGQGLLQVIFEDGKFYNETTLTKIREKLNN